VEFLGIGYQELLLVFVLLLVVVGPERLPGMAYQLGKAVRTMQRYARAVRDEFREEIDYFDEQVKTVQGEFNEARTAMKQQEREFRAEMRAIDQEAKVDLPSLLGPATPATPGTTTTNGNTPAATAAPSTPAASPLAATESQGAVRGPQPAAPPSANGSHSYTPATPAGQPKQEEAAASSGDSGKKPLVF
jgi:sec-independent protein translocase protein TatB